MIRLELPPGAELHGELTDWRHPRVLPDGLFTEDLPAGLYAYKVKVDGEWVAPSGRTRSVGGHRNEVLVVSGTPEPLLFAPGLPCVTEDADGTLRVFAALRRGHGDELRLRSREDPGDPFVAAECVPFVDEDEHRVFLARLPVSSDVVELAFEVPGGPPIPVQSWVRPPRARAEILNVYTIFVDRFRRANGVLRDPGRDAPAGGDLDGVTASLDELEELGVDTLYLTPVQLSASCHRYDLVDPLRVDPALGGEEAFARLVAATTARGMKLLLDFSFVHVGRGFPPFEDVLAHGRASTYASWFLWDDGDRLRHYGHRDDAALLDLRAEPVRALALATAEHLARLGVSGFRFDAIADVPLDFARAVRARLREIRPDAVVLGEVVPAHAFRFAGAVDLATDFAFHELATEFVAKRSIDAARFDEGLRRAELARGSADAKAVRFLSTHDHPRFASIARRHGGTTRDALGLLLLLASPGVPALLYGDELGLSSADVSLEVEGAWADRMPMRFFAHGELGPRETSIRTLVRDLLRLRRETPALVRGTTETLFAEGPLLVFRRRADAVLDVAIHAGDEPLEIELADDQLASLTPLVTVGEVRVEGQTLFLGRDSGVLALRGKSAEQRERQSGFVRALPVLRDRDFRSGSPSVAGRPMRLDFSLTERCNLRCAHCLTLAPEKTAAGTARTMSHAVLDRLRDDLAHASWFGFVHGGESLTSPMLFEVLAAIRAARADAMVHLLTNGKLLRPAMTERLHTHGVRSLFVSLDGATAETNDRVRIGGDFHAICANVKAAVRLRDEQRLDLRIGISSVVLRSNLAELTDLVELAARLGVDWLKLEEPVPATPFAREEMIELGPALDARVAAALERARELGLRVVDHLAPPPVWRCRLDERSRAFLEADEFANRTEIHPCRAAWERACIFPNGDVAIDDFLLPVVGNVLQTPLAELWNGPAARLRREHARAAWLCGGDVTCVG